MNTASPANWLELLKQVSPDVARVVVLRDAAIPSGNAQFATIQAVAQSFGVEVSPVNVRDTGEIERARSDSSCARSILRRRDVIVRTSNFVCDEASNRIRP